MDNQIIVFTGSKRDFEKFISDYIDINEETMPFMRLIQHYNARLRLNGASVRESELSRQENVDNCIVRADDFGSVLEHVISNFVNIVTLNNNIKRLIIHNPPKRVLESLISAYPENLEYHFSKYQRIDKAVLKQIYRGLCNDILGQDTCKKQIISGLYRLLVNTVDKPVVLLLYGPSGVGKTESAKSISRTLGGELLRIQFSMMHSNEAYNYVFGAEHSKSSFARDMLGRESNIILIDEFDKVNPVFYNAFYELFDEGKYVDSNYDVDLKNSVFMCTTNFRNEHEIRNALGPAMFSRIGCLIKYEDISIEQKQAIIQSWYTEIVSRLEPEDSEYIHKTDIKNWFSENAKRYDNIRILKTKLENAIFDELTDTFIIN